MRHAAAGAVALSLAGSLACWPSRATGQEATPPESQNPPIEQAQTSAAPLLREGAYFAAVPGRVKRDEQFGFWTFVPENTSTPARAPLLVLLPCTKLEQMQRTIEAAGDDVLFEMTGRIFVFGRRNFLLPLSAPLLERTAPAATDADNSADPAADPPTEAEGERDAEAMIRELRNDVPIVRSLATETTGEATDETAGDGVPARGSEGSLIMSRRGMMSRSAEGGWRFVFAADASGLADPPMTLLPCLLLERMQEIVAQRGESIRMLITGEVYSFRGRDFLLPTMFQVERPTRNLGR